MTPRSISFAEDGPDQGIFLDKEQTLFVVDVPEEIADAYDYASEVWALAQAKIREWYYAEREKFAPHQDAFDDLMTDDLTTQQFEARIAGCTHESRWKYSGLGMEKRDAKPDEAGSCRRCGQFTLRDGV